MHRVQPTAHSDSITEVRHDLDELMALTQQSRLILIHGPSCHGNARVIDEGLVKRMDQTNWSPIYVRRMGDINISFCEALGISIAECSQSRLEEAILALHNHTLKPVYVIVEDLESLFILGDIEEQREFMYRVERILALEAPVTFILTIKESHIGHLFQFERILPDLFTHRFRVHAD